MSVQGLTISRLPDVLVPALIVKSGEDIGRYIRLALIVAMLSVCFERSQDDTLPLTQHWLLSAMLAAGVGVALAASLTEKYSRIAVAAFGAFLLYDTLENWALQANHSWLAVWTIPVAMLFARWWEEPLYADYLRTTLGVVMLGAAAQKLLAGTYLDGSYMAFLSHYGSSPQDAFRLLCSYDTLYNPCGWHIFMGTFIVLWQIGVGFLLLAGLRSVLFLLIEVGFLLAAGIYADEMNFQVLNIALLCIAFRVGMSYWLFAACVGLLFIDLYDFDWIIDHVL